MKVTLYSLPISHPARCARLMLDYKGILYRHIDLVNGPHAGVLRALGFSHGTVPALKIDGRKIQGTLDISQALDQLRPDPPLFPADPQRRAAVDKAERWGERELQQIARLVAVAAFKRDRSTIPEFMADAHPSLPLPARVMVATSRPLVMMQDRRHGAGDQPTRAAIERLPWCFDHVEELIARGVIGNELPNAADFQIATSLRLLTLFEDVRPALQNRPVGRFALRVVPEYPGHFEAVLPSGWLTPLRDATARASGT